MRPGRRSARDRRLKPALPLFRPAEALPPILYKLSGVPESLPVTLKACTCCGLVQRIGPVHPGHTALCARCRAVVALPARPHAHARVAALSLAALILYPFAMGLPVLEIEKFGHIHSATIWSGTVELLSDGQLAVGVLIFVCSIVVPLLKLGGLLAISAGRVVLGPRHRMLTFRAIDHIGRWGMIDVLLVAILVAAVKLGNWADVHAGPGVFAFAAVVVLSLAASASFDPLRIWEEEA